ncbi:hypothetical protein C0J52_19950 [Blattella germanica]|nr:hypothetical protein C0J52_19950 [Blattella germanica]
MAEMDLEETIRRVVRESLQDKSIFNSLANIIKDTVAGAHVAEMKGTIDKNTEVLIEMKTALEEKDKKIADLESTLLEKSDDLEQYQRRQCLRIFSVEETREEDTDKLVLDVAAKIGVDLQIRDTDRCHRQYLKLYKEVRTPENVERVRVALLHSPTRSAVRGISDRCVRRILHLDLHFHPFKIQMVHELGPADFNQRTEFCRTNLNAIDNIPLEIRQTVMASTRRSAELCLREIAAI